MKHNPDQLDLLIMEIRKLVKAIERDQSTWCDPDEAARLLGFQHTRSGTHRRRVRWLVEKGFITRFRSGKPFMYDREEVKRVAKKISDGEIVAVGFI